MVKFASRSQDENPRALFWGCNSSDLASTSEKPEASNTKLSSDAESTEDDEEIDEDLKVIPPEIVSGSYLVCKRVDDDQGGEHGHLAAALLMAGKNGIVSVNQYNPKWQVYQTIAELKLHPLKTIQILV